MRFEFLWTAHRDRPPKSIAQLAFEQTKNKRAPKSQIEYAGAQNILFQRQEIVSDFEFAEKTTVCVFFVFRHRDTTVLTSS